MRLGSTARMLAAVAALIAAAGRADAVLQYDRFQIEGEVTMQSTFQHDSLADFEYVQQRQQLQLGLVSHLVKEEDQQPFLRKSDVSLLWRGRYDAIFDLRDRYRRREYDRNDFRFPEGSHPRELYVDLEFNQPLLRPFSLRVGRQQVVWGEADFFRSLDVVNPLRIDQMGLVGDDLDKYREPLWIAKMLVHFGSVPWISQFDVEALYSPDGRPLTNKLILGNGWRINEAGYGCELRDPPQPIDCERPHKLPFRRVRQPWEIERVGPDYGFPPDQGDINLDAAIPALPVLGASDRADFIYLGHQRYGDKVNLAGNGYREIDPARRSMAGIRFMGQTFAGIYFTLNYIWKRAEIPAPGIGWAKLFDPATGDGSPNLRGDKAAEAVANFTSPDADGDGVPDGNEAAFQRCLRDSETMLIIGPVASGSRTAYGYRFPNESVGQACVPIPLHYPHTHIVGGTLTYNDYDYTGTILRMEQSLSTKEPRTIFPALVGTRAGDYPHTRDFDTGGWTQTDIWRSMIGFDYLRAPFKVYSLPGWLRRSELARSLLTDQWFFTFQFFNEYWSHVSHQLGQDFSITNRHQHWNPVLTWIQTGFFLREKLRPTIALAYEVDTSFPVAW
ncbi:MAG: hypothetical protein QOD06_2671, partial [Candidatus Binatota bacterium]|nr:hypothetical protein [Candidatus Binatota bacterium]